MKSRTLALLLSIIVLLSHGGCASLDKSDTQTIPASLNTPIDDFDSSMRKKEQEFMMVALVVIVVAIIAGASISASSGGGGLSVGINK